MNRRPSRKARLLIPPSFPGCPADVHDVRGTSALCSPANFFIGNVHQDWHVDVTDKTRANGHWVEVYVPNAKLWGYIERGNLS